MLATLSFTMGEAAAAYETRTAECGESYLTIDGGDPSPFALPQDAPKTLTIHPDDVITIFA
ncbi:hypothetical protein M1O29_04400, partial [Dehalococcoidia bacterium]|nr:hypothetical protein [Dehalococcoidia bacterium]